MKLAFIVGAVILLAGCSTTTVNPDNAKQIPPERVIYSGVGSAKLTVTRDSGFLGAGRQIGLFIGSKLAARFEAGESTTFNVAKGNYTIGVSYVTSDDLSNRDANYYEININSDNHKYYRITAESGSLSISNVSLKPYVKTE